MTPLSECANDSGCMHATFRIVGDGLDPAKITDMFKIHPSAAAAKGQRNPMLHTRGGVASRTGYWMVTSEGSVQSQDLETHLRFLLDLFEPVRSGIAQLAALEDLRIELHCYWMSETGYGGPTLSADLLRRIADLGVALDFDIYFAGDD